MHRFEKYSPIGAYPLLLLETPLPPNSNSQLTVCFKPFHLFHSNSQLIQRLWSWFGIFYGSNMLSAYPGRFFTTQLGRSSMFKALSLLSKSRETGVLLMVSCEQINTQINNYNNKTSASRLLLFHSRKKY